MNRKNKIIIILRTKVETSLILITFLLESREIFTPNLGPPYVRRGTTYLLFSSVINIENVEGSAVVPFNSLARF